MTEPITETELNEMPEHSDEGFAGDIDVNEGLDNTPAYLLVEQFGENSCG